MNEMEQELILGFDCGGTKTKVDIACKSPKAGPDDKGLNSKIRSSLAEGGLDGSASSFPELIDSFTVGGMNVNSLGKEKVLQNLQEAFDRIGPECIRKVKALCFGAAGISNPLTREVFLEASEKAGIEPEPVLIGDNEAALYGAFGLDDGIILVSGTGSICCGRRRDKDNWITARAGGYGHLIDDEGSGYALGRDLLSAVVRSEDGRLDKTPMREEVFEALSIGTVQELIKFVYAPATTKKEIAALAPILQNGLDRKEPAAQAIVEKAACELVKLVKPVAAKLSLEQGCISFAGSVLTKNTYIADLVSRLIREEGLNLTVVEPRYDPAFGALIKAAEALSLKE
ncbi:MAG: ATPase [Firmicutes bacterium]|nr:ATPase [Bacillota bacterium]